ncbi:hypothetical protein O6H91_23G071600 [Diphasiastrum complanatum]|uniref:Uncharacterized protein n=1 Tax=Diphasiastrum complanatum TaxID=34168 RepID=A0ACC2AC60_DIPCM|nr:hypothetical protein O6H91_23G071600 [Diphasiastrum complanatum]
MEDLLGKGIFNVDGEHWKIQRKVASHEFTTRSLRDFTMESVAREVKRRLLPTLEHFCQSRVCFDLLQELLMCFSSYPLASFKPAPPPFLCSSFFFLF